jgi:hypothetical protein
MDFETYPQPSERGIEKKKLASVFHSFFLRTCSKIILSFGGVILFPNKAMKAAHNGYM